MKQMAYPGQQGTCYMEGCVLWRNHAGGHTSQPYWPEWLRDRFERIGTCQVCGRYTGDRYCYATGHCKEAGGGEVM